MPLLRIKTLVEVRWNGLLVHRGRNLITSVGKALVASLVSGTGDAPSHMAMGASGTPAAEGRVALQGTEHERVAMTPGTADNVLTFTAQFGATLVGDVTVQEFGLFNAAAAGTMFARFVTSQFTAGAGDAIDVTWQLTFD